MKNLENAGKNILFLIEQAGTLMQMPRSHIRTLGNTFDTIASHSFLVGIIAYCLARMEKLSSIEAMKALSMGCFHDLAEGRSADLDFISKNYTQDDEQKAIFDQFKNLPFGDELIELLSEYNLRQSKISQCVKDADQLAQMHHEWTLMWRGNKLAEKWFNHDFKNRLPYFFTKSAKDLAKQLKNSDPNEWWWHELVESGKPKNKENLLGRHYFGKNSPKPKKPNY